MSDEERIEAATRRYQAAAHAMQSGVALEMNYNLGPTEPKHLRVGVNVAMCDHGGLVGLLIRKGVITEAEYREAIADSMEREQRFYEEQATARYGKPITFG